MEPLISIQLLRPGRIYQPRETLSCEYQVDAIDSGEITAVETSVLWYTEGKGDEDLSVHYFERRTPADAEDGDLRPLHRFHIRLPNSPLSYQGAILCLKLCIRVRLFLKKGRQFVAEQPFTVGSVPPVSLDQNLPEPPENNDCCLLYTSPSPRDS